MCLRLPKRFVRTEAELDECLRDAKLLHCPHCRRAETLIGHGLLWGYSERSGERIIRGRRLLCSNRWCRPGCGLTFAISLADVLSGFVVRSKTLLDFVSRVLSGEPRRAAWRTASEQAFSVSSGYRLWRRLSQAQSSIKTRLLSLAQPPSSSASEPWAQLLEHLRVALPTAQDYFAAFQLQFQCHLLP